MSGSMKIYLLLLCCGIACVESKSVLTRERRNVIDDLDLTYKACVSNSFCNGNGECYESTDVNKLKICRYVRVFRMFLRDFFPFYEIVFTFYVNIFTFYEICLLVTRFWISTTVNRGVCITLRNRESWILTAFVFISSRCDTNTMDPIVKMK